MTWTKITIPKPGCNYSPSSPSLLRSLLDCEQEQGNFVFFNVGNFYILLKVNLLFYISYFQLYVPHTGGSSHDVALDGGGHIDVQLAEGDDDDVPNDLNLDHGCDTPRPVPAKEIAEQRRKWCLSSPSPTTTVICSSLVTEGTNVQMFRCHHTSLQLCLPPPMVLAYQLPSLQPPVQGRLLLLFGKLSLSKWRLLLI